MDLDVQLAEKRATRRFALRLPVSVNYAGDSSGALAAQTRDVSARVDAQAGQTQHWFGYFGDGGIAHSLLQHQIVA